MAMWQSNEAVRLAAKRRFADEIGPCPNCGATAIVEAICITPSWGAEAEYVPGLADCTAKCYDDDPDGYLAAVARYREAESGDKP